MPRIAIGPVPCARTLLICFGTLPVLLGADATGAHAQATAAAGGQGIETRNEPIRVQPSEVVDGPVRARNGRISIGARADVGAIATRNGRIEVEEYTIVRGAVESRNGRVELGEAVDVHGGVSTRNGAIDLGAGAQVYGPVESRNGRIRLGEDGWIGGDVDTRNGAVDLARGATVEGGVKTRNGSVRLEHARVAGEIDVMNGDVHLGGATRVEGDLIVLMPEERGIWSWLPFLGSTRSDPVIRIEAGAYVGGRLIVDERARLEIANGADVPEPEVYPSREAWERR